MPLLEINQKPDIILLNPTYGENKRLKFLLPSKEITGFILEIQKKLPYWVVKTPIKVMALATVNRWSLIDDEIIRDVRRANSQVATQLLYIMSCDKWVISDIKNYDKCYLIYSNKDRVILKPNMDDLNEDLKPLLFKTFYGAGHTLVIERCDELATLIENIIWGGSKDEEYFK